MRECQHCHGDLDKGDGHGPGVCVAALQRRSDEYNHAEAVDHPQHYGGANDPYEAIKVIEAWGVGFHVGIALKHIARAGKKANEPEDKDIEKAVWYLKRYLEVLKEEKGGRT